MSWLYSQVLVEEYSEDTSLDGAQCALWNGTHTQQASWLPVKMTDACRLSRSGMTFKPLTDDLGEAVLMSYLEAFPVRTCPAQEPTTTRTGNKWALMEQSLVCGRTWRESLGRLSLNVRSSRTLPICAAEDLTESCATLTPWGIMQDGVCLGLGTLERITSENECGFLPTPTAHNAKEGAYPAEFTRNTKTLAAQVGGRVNPDWNEQRMGWPTRWTDLKPLAMDKIAEWRLSHLAYLPETSNP